MTISDFKKANKLKREGKLEEAIAFYLKTIQENPSFHWSYFYLGEIFADLGSWEEAIANYQKAIELNSNFSRAFCNLGEVLAKVGRWEEAIAAYQKVIEINPEKLEAYLQIGILCLETDKLEESYLNLNRVIIEEVNSFSLSSKLANSYAKLGEKWQSQGKLNEAIKSYQKAIALQPDIVEWQLNLAEAFLTMGNFSQAIRSYEIVAEFKPDLIEAELYYKLAVDLRQQNDLEKAVTFYRKALSLNPDNFTIENGLAEILQMRCYQDLAEVKSIDARLTGINKDVKCNPIPPESLYSLVSKLPTRPSADLGFHIITPVWGKDYTDKYIHLFLPTIATPGNLLAFKNTKAATYIIYTTLEDAETIVNSPVYLMLKEVIAVDIKTFVDEKVLKNKSGKYGAMSLCHNDAIVEAAKEDRALVFLAPDTIWAEQSFANMIKIAQTGKRAIMAPGLCLSQDSCISFLVKQFNFSSKFDISINARELVKISLNHLHLEAKSFFMTSPLYSLAGTIHIYWEVGKKGLVARCFVLHPLMVKPSKKDILIKTTLDMEYVFETCSLEDIYVATDSDEMYYCDLKRVNDYRELSIANLANKSREVEIAKWAKNYASPHHLEFFSKHRIRIHTDDIDEDWQKIENESNQVVEKIMNYIAEKN